MLGLRADVWPIRKNELEAQEEGFMVLKTLKTVTFALGLLSSVFCAKPAHAEWIPYDPYTRFDINSCDFRLDFTANEAFGSRTRQIRAMHSAVASVRQGEWGGIKLHATAQDVDLLARMNAYRPGELEELKLELSHADRGSISFEFLAFDNQPSDGTLQLYLQYTFTVDGKIRGNSAYLNTAETGIKLEQHC